MLFVYAPRNTTYSAYRTNRTGRCLGCAAAVYTWKYRKGKKLSLVRGREVRRRRRRRRRGEEEGGTMMDTVWLITFTCAARAILLCTKIKKENSYVHRRQYIYLVFFHNWLRESGEERRGGGWIGVVVQFPTLGFHASNVKLIGKRWRHIRREASERKVRERESYCATVAAVKKKGKGGRKKNKTWTTDRLLPNPPPPPPPQSAQPLLRCDPPPTAVIFSNMYRRCVCGCVHHPRL